MRVCVFGGGSVGGYLAGSLAEGGAQISVVARGAHLKAIRADGLRVETPGRSFTVRLPASDDPSEFGQQDAVLVTVKSPSLPQVAAGIAPLLHKKTAVAFVMNGIPWWYFHAHGGPLDGRRLTLLDPGDALWRTVTPQRALGGIFWPAGSVPAPGVVRLLSGAGRGTAFGEPDGRITPRVEAIAAAFRAAGLPVSITADIRTLLWQKLAFNLSAGPLCVLTETSVRDTQTEDALVASSRRVLAEADALASSMGITLDIDVDNVVAINRDLGHRPSILQDLEAGRPMEIDALYGVPLEMARITGVAMPTLELLASLIKAKARAKGLYSGGSGTG
jgi:2-dehydropantoate 2-reductase